MWARDDTVRQTLRRWGAWLLPSVVMVVCLLALIPLATGSLIGGLAAIALIVGVTSIGVVGFEGTAIGALVLGVALSPMDNLRPVGAISFVSLADVFLLVGIGCLLPIVFSKRWTLDPFFMVAVAGLTGTALISSALADEPGASLNSVLRLVVGAMLLPLAFMIWRPGPTILLLFAWSYLLGNVANFAASFTQGVGDGGRRIGFSTHPNIMGLCAMLAVGIAIVLWEVLPRRYGVYALMCGVLCLGSVWVSGSRAALVAAAAMVALYPVISRSIVTAVALFGASLPVIFIAARTILSGENVSDNAFGRLLGGGSAQGSDLEREMIAEVARGQFHDHPILGVGLADVLAAHNIYLQIAAAIGIIGLTFFVAMLGSVLLRCFSIDRRFMLLVLPCFGYVMIGALTTIIWDRYVWCVLALPFLLPLRRETEDEAEQAQEAADGADRADARHEAAALRAQGDGATAAPSGRR
ncbi:O-antigen ligase family protein [Aeromicrobium alkaliterrae]|uniref:O-antigen ligase-related domain-containing protein n=1 Tax=Aeromicrobium alkaliterrae TaxID=302168 RepID=A0ABN2K2W1_9ACTN